MGRGSVFHTCKIVLNNEGWFSKLNNNKQNPKLSPAIIFKLPVFLPLLIKIFHIRGDFILSLFFFLCVCPLFA